VLAAILNPKTPLELRDRLVGNLERLAQTLVNAVAAKLVGVSAQETARAALAVARALEEVHAFAVAVVVALVSGGATTWEELRKALNGASPSEVFGSPDTLQVNILDRFFALIEARTDLSYPKAAYEEFKAAHERMKELLRAEEAADAARDTLTLAQKAAEKGFAPSYRFLIRDLLFNVGEDVVRDNLPRFERRRSRSNQA
jgi:hypothetical protein